MMMMMMKANVEIGGKFVETLRTKSDSKSEGLNLLLPEEANSDWIAYRLLVVRGTRASLADILKVFR